MPLPPHGPNDRRPNSAESPLPDAYAATGPASGPPPFPLTRRKQQADAAQAAQSLPPPPPPPLVRSGTAPWPLPPSSRAPNLGDPGTAEMTDVAEASTPFASAVDLEPDPSEISDGLESDADRPTSVSPWWRRFRAPSRPVVVGALAAAVAAGLGWTAGARPWASHRAHPVLAAKAAAKRSGPAHPAPARAAAPHPNRRAAVNTKSKAPSAASKPQAKPAPGVKHLAASGSGTKARAQKPTTNKPPSKMNPASKGKALSHATSAKAKAATAHNAKTSAKPKAAKPKSLAAQ